MVVASSVCPAVVTASNQNPASTAEGQALPRTPEGRPDFSGFWQVLNTAAFDIQDHSARLGVPAGQGVVEGNEIPYQAWAAAKKAENFAARGSADPATKCYLPGVPRATYIPFPFQIVQEPAHVAILYEYVHGLRNIFLDNSPHPPGHIDWWMGDSRGHWESDTLVVDVTHFNNETWFDAAGNFHSEALHVVERYSFVDPDTINYQVMIEDPQVFTRPWNMSMLLYRHKEENFQLLDYECYAFDGIAIGTREIDRREP
jgi:hypothetical protein